MGHDRVASVHDPCVIAALIEHTHIQSEDVGQIDRTAGRTLIRADGHHMVAVDFQVFDRAQQSFDKLISGRNGFEPA